MITLNRIIIAYLSIYTAILSAENVFIDLPDGEIMGSVEITVTNTSYFSFRGIPYAKPPLEELRFQAPQPVDPWTETLDATYDKSICYQVPVDSSAENEDCLHINVFVPQDPSSAYPLPVMVFIHGGGFIRGSGSPGNYGPQHFMEYGVIIVSFNYRLGPFGFFSTGDSAIPGNAGLKDQNMALQWVQKNIQYFGGDPNQVTIFGQSAGSASVAYHLLSPKSKGLFRAAICESGSALNPWAYQRDQVYYTFKTAGVIDPSFDGNDMSSSELLEFLTNATPRLIDSASYNVSLMDTPDNLQIQQGFFYGPVVEYDHEDAFITQQMYENFKNGDINNVPIIIGANSGESVRWFADDYLKTIAEAFDDDLTLTIPRDMHIEDEATKAEVAAAIKSVYSPDSNFADNTANLTQFFIDNCFTRGIIKQAEFMSNVNKVYYYQFSYLGPLGGNTNQAVEGFSDRVKHSEELGYLFVRKYTRYNTSDLSQFSESDILVQKRFITLFTNFAKTLNPTPEESELLENIIWPTVDATDFAYLDIGSYSELRQHPREEFYQDWESIYSEYGIPPYDTY